MLRASRASLQALLVLGLAASAHTLGGGTAPGPVSLGVLGLLLAPVAWWASGRQLRAGRLLALLGGAQALVHAALTAMSPGVGDGLARHVHGGLPTALGASPAVADHVHPALGPSMLLAHGAATVLAALLLAHAESVLWRALARLLPRVPAAVRVRACAPVLPEPAPLRLTGRSVRPLGGRAPPLAVA